MLATVLVTSGEKSPENLANIKQGTGKKKESREDGGVVRKEKEKGALTDRIQLRPRIYSFLKLLITKEKKIFFI